MSKLVAVISLLVIVAAYAGCQDRRQEEQEKSTELERVEKTNEMDKGYDGREMGGGGGNGKN